ncbi:MAG TPA: YkgJ family cysteine cluster protein [Acetobacteraceae bacterium]|nr:YkgJ family cysteine cluster protein [Acetobacteraceae bacterium]
MLQREVLAGRECGSCNACCVSLTIDDPELQKPQGFRCKNARPDNSCAIYPTRPQTCREFNCGWRLLKWVKQPLRPDRSGVLIRLHSTVSRTTGESRMGVIFTLLNRSSLKAEGLAETVAAAVAADVPVFVSIPGPPGHTSAQARLNDALLHAVQTRDKAAVLEVLRQAWRGGRGGATEPIKLRHRPADPGAPAK